MKEKYMFAVIETGGKQYQVSPGDKIMVELLGKTKGEVTFKNVLLLNNEGNLKLGSPYIKGASVKAKILGEAKTDKVIIFKKKRRKQYKRTRGHRQKYTVVLIEEIKEG